MDELARLWDDLAGRLTGPMTFRLVLQPLMATFYASRDGLKDARDGRRPYFWKISHVPEQRRRLLLEGAQSVGRVIALGVVMDLVYEWIVYRRFYPVELVIVVFLLAFLPYLVMRGIVNRIARRGIGSGKASAS